MASLEKNALAAFFLLISIVTGSLALTSSISHHSSVNPHSQLAALDGAGSGLVGWWKFDEGSGTSATDSSGNNNTGTLLNSPTWATGQIDGALSFNGTSNCVSIGSPSTLNMNTTNAFTISAWINPQDITSTNKGIFVRGYTNSSAANTTYYLGISNNGGRLFGRVSDGTTRVSVESSSNILTADKWTYAALAWDGNSKTLFLYQNGSINNSATDSTFTALWDGNEAADRYTAIGSSGGCTASYYNATLDDIRVYNRALSASEISDLYNQGLSGGGTPTNQAPVVSAGSNQTIILPSTAALSGTASDDGLPTGSTLATTWSLISGGSVTFSDPSSLNTIATFSSAGTYVLQLSASDSVLTSTSNVTVAVNPAPSQDTQAPTVPTNLTATAISSSQINLSWAASTDNVGVAGYNIYRGGVQIGSSATNSYPDSGLSASTAYTYAVSAYDSVPNTSGQSISINATTLTGFNKVELLNSSGNVLNTFGTIQACADTAQANDTCLVYPGSYGERVMMKNSGNYAGKITFKSKMPQMAYVLHGFNTNGKDYIRIEGFDITHDKAGWNGGGILIYGNNIDIVGNYIHDVPGIGINMYDHAENINVSNNKLYKVNKGILAAGKNWLVENNEVERLYRFDIFNATLPGEDADYSRFFGENIVFSHNYFHGTFQSEISDGATHISHTDGFQSFQSASASAYDKDIVIDGNIVQSFAEAIMIDQVTGANGHLLENIIVRNNVFSTGDTSKGEKEATNGIIAHGVTNLVIDNNVFANINLGAVSCRASKTDGYGSTCTVNNNIFLNAGYNYYADSTSSIQGGFNMLTPPKTGYTYSPNDLFNKDPLFFDIHNIVGLDKTPFTQDDGYLLRASSPAIDTGTNLSGLVDKDIFNTSRPQGSAWDIGAYEYVGGGGGLTTYTVIATKLGTGSGMVTSNVGGINCGPTCTSSALNSGTSVTLTAAPDSSSVFTGWGGACSGTSPTCTFTLSSNTTVTATFNTTGGQTYQSADLNQNGRVNAQDFSILLSYWGNTTKPPADINQNGIVNAQDFSIMLSQWTG